MPVICQKRTHGHMNPSMTVLDVIVYANYRFVLFDGLFPQVLDD